MDLVERSAPSETKKEIMHGVGARNMGALATWDSFAPPKREKRIMVRTWTNWNLIREPLGTSWP
jgi:hypothetical protein